MISVKENEKWDEIVKSFKEYDVYYLSGYAKAFQLHGDGEPLLLYLEDGETRAINVVMKRDIAKDKNFAGRLEVDTYFDFTTPYGYGGFIFEGDKSNLRIKNLSDEYENYCMENNIICEFVRFHPILENQNEMMYETVNVGATISIKIDNSEQIFLDFDSKCRNMVRKAKKNGIEISCIQDKEICNEFMKIYNDTMLRDNARDYYYFDKSFYQSILKDFSENATFFCAKLNQEIIAISIIMFCNNQMHYHLSATKKEHMHLAPTNLLIYEASIWGSQREYKSFHLGGGLGGKEDSLFKFKKSFNKKGTQNSFYIGKRIFNQKQYQKLLEIRMQHKNYVPSTNFFPEYRA